MPRDKEGGGKKISDLLKLFLQMHMAVQKKLSLDPVHSNGYIHGGKHIPLSEKERTILKCIYSNISANDCCMFSKV